MSRQIKLNNDKLYSYRVSLLNLPSKYKIRRDLIDTANMAKNIIIEEFMGQNRRPQRKRGKPQRGGFTGGRGNTRGGDAIEEEVCPKDDTYLYHPPFNE
jgi:hypothetical protein